MATTQTTPKPAATPDSAAATQLTTSPEGTDTPLFTQSYSFKIPRDWEGVPDIFTDPKTNEINYKALVYAIRAGMKQIINNRVRQLFTKLDDKSNPTFKAVAETYDATSLILDAPLRVVRSQREKLEKNLQAANLPQAVIDQMLSTYDTNVGKGEEDTSHTSVDLTDAQVFLAKDGKKLVMKVGRKEEEEEEEE